MDNHEIVRDIESTGNTSTQSPPPVATSQARDEVPSWSKPLEDALKKNDWNAVKEILDKEPEAIYGPVGYRKDTPLVYAVEEDLDMGIIENLINMMPPEKLVYSKEEIGKRLWSAIHWAASLGNYRAAKLLISKYPPMLSALDYWGRTPIQKSLYDENTEMACYMLKVGLIHIQHPHQFDEASFVKDLEYAIKERKYEFAYILIEQFPKLALHFSPWKVLIEECKDLPGRSRLNMLQSIIYPRIHMNDEIVLKSLTHEWEKANSRLESATSEIQSPKDQYSLGTVSLLKSVRELKLRHHQVLELARILCMKFKEYSVGDRSDILRPVFCLAVHNGVSNIVKLILKEFPHAIKYQDNDENNVLQFAVSHRDGKTFKVVYTKYMWDDIVNSLDNKGNNLLHLVAKKARRNRLGIGSGKVLQLQREFQWYKELENELPSELKFQKNEEKKVPLEIFDEEHKDMLRSETEWLTSMSNSCMVAGSLIAAVVFAAAITLPGGNNDDDGLPKLSKERAFKVFACSDAGALIFSLTAVVTFLSIFTTRFSVESFQYDLPIRLVIGLISLFLSVTFLMIAFCTTVYLLFAHTYNWIMYPTMVFSFLPVFFFAYLQLPSLVNIIKSTYDRDIYKDDNVTVLVMNPKERNSEDTFSEDTF